MKPTGLIFSATLLASLALVASPAIARDTQMKAEVNTTTMHDNGDVTTRHTTTNKTANSNGPSAIDRDTGLDRAEDRMSAEGRAHSHALKKHTADSDEERSTTTTTTSTHTR
jgi:hypothetical protein